MVCSSSRRKISQLRRRVLDIIRKDAIVAEARDVDDLNSTTEGHMWSHHLHLIPLTMTILLLGNNLPGPACQMALEDSPWAGGSPSVFILRAAYHKDN